MLLYSVTLVGMRLTIRTPANYLFPFCGIIGNFSLFISYFFIFLYSLDVHFSVLFIVSKTCVFVSLMFYAFSFIFSTFSYSVFPFLTNLESTLFFVSSALRLFLSGLLDIFDVVKARVWMKY